MRKKTKKEIEIAEKIEKQLKSKLMYPLDLITSFEYIKKFSAETDPDYEQKRFKYPFDSMPEGYEIYTCCMYIGHQGVPDVFLMVFDTALETIIFIEDFYAVRKAASSKHPLSIAAWKRF